MHWLIFCIQFGQFSTELQIFDKMRRWKIPETMRCIAFNQSLCKPWWLCLGRYDPTRAYWSTNKATKEKKYFGSSHEYFWLQKCSKCANFSATVIAFWWPSSPSPSHFLQIISLTLDYNNRVNVPCFQQLWLLSSSSSSSSVSPSSSSSSSLSYFGL